MSYEQMLEDIAYQKHLAICVDDKKEFESYGKKHKHLLLVIAIKYLLRLGVDLPTVVSVWNDVVEGKED